VDRRTGAAALAAIVVMRPDVVAVDVVSVERGPLTVTIDEDGITRIRNHAEIAAPVTDDCWPATCAPATL
jgi:hypothetical protein